MKSVIIALLTMFAWSSPTLAGSCSPEILAKHGEMRKILAEFAGKGLRGAHHYSITFLTSADGVTLPAELRSQYPQEMSVILQHQFEHLVVSDDRFDVVLSFKGLKKRVVVPFNAITHFIDPSVNFRLEFDPASPEQWCGTVH
jgi:hypothetical protein